MSRRAAVVAGLCCVLFAALAAVRADDLWRSAYPHLPRRVQGAPYRIRAVVSGPTHVPVAVPTARPGAATPVPSDAATGRTAPSTFPRATARAVGATSTSPPVSGLPTAEVPPTSAPVMGAPADAPATSSVPGVADLGDFRHEYQTWNNCGPATLSMALGYWGTPGNQADAARGLKPDPDDKNVSPDELARFARDRGMGAVVRVNGTAERLKRLVAAGVPVIVETWFVPEPGDEMGHYRVLSGYSDELGVFLAHDSYNGPFITLPYEEFDALWRVFNRVYLPVYPREREADVAGIMGPEVDDRVMHQGATARAQAELIEAEDAFAWFNLGSGLLGLGDAEGAAGAFDRARSIGLPWRLLWYRFEPFEAYAAVGRWEDVLALADANLRNAPNLEESHYWRGRALAAVGDLDGAAAAWRRAQELNPLYVAPAAALDGLRGR